MIIALEHCLLLTMHRKVFVNSPIWILTQIVKQSFQTRYLLVCGCVVDKLCFNLISYGSLNRNGLSDCRLVDEYVSNILVIDFRRLP